MESTRLPLLLTAAALACLGSCSKDKHGATEPLAIPGELPNLLAKDAKGLLFIRSLDAAEEAIGGSAGEPGPIHAWFSSILGFDASRTESGRAAALGILTIDDAGEVLALQPIVRGASDADLKNSRRDKSWSQVQIGKYHALFPGKKVAMDAGPRPLLTELRPGDLAFAFLCGGDAAKNTGHVRQLASLLGFTGPKAWLPLPEPWLTDALTPALAQAASLQASIGMEGRETRLQFSVKSDHPPLESLTSDAGRAAAMTYAKSIPEHHAVAAVFGVDMAAAMRQAGPLLTSIYGSAPAPIRIAYSTYFLLHESLYGRFGAGASLSLHGSENGMEEILIATVNNPRAFLTELERIVRDPGFASGGIAVDSVSTEKYEGCEALQFRLLFEPAAFSLPASAPAELTDMVREAGRLLYGMRGLQVQACAVRDAIVYMVSVPDTDARQVVRTTMAGTGKLPLTLAKAVESLPAPPHVAVVSELRGLLRASIHMRNPGNTKPLPPILRSDPLPAFFWLRAGSQELTGGGSLRVKDALELWKFAQGG